MTEIVTALIAGGMALVGTVITTLAASRRTEQQLRTRQAVTDTKIEALTREVREHNDFAHRMPVLEEKIRVINRRIGDLEGYHKPKEG